MGEGDCDFREKEIVEEGPEVAVDEAGVDYSVDEHQVLDVMPQRVRQFYFVKVLPLENSNTDAMIKAEETIEKMNQDQILIAQKIRERQMDRTEVISKLGKLKYFDNNEITLKWNRERMNILHLSLDKLTLANNAYKGRPINSCLSGGEVDKQKLCFLMVHGCKNMADERKLLREVNASQGKDGGLTVDEPLGRPMCSRCWRYSKTDTVAFEIAKERAIADAAVNGKLWNSLGSKKAIKAEVFNNRSDELRKRQMKVRAKIGKTKKELERVEKVISSLQKHLIDRNHRKDEAYDTILKLKKQYGEENACYYQHRSLMKKVEVLAKKKDVAAVQELSQGQVEKFMQQWNSCQDFRNDYKKRVVPSLNNQHLGIDGRMIINQKPQVEDARKVIKPEALSKTRLKWLMKEAEDPSELLS